MKSLLLGLAASLVLTSTAAGQFSFTIDTTQRRQVWDGFGFAAVGSWNPTVAQLMSDAAFATQISDDLKPAIVRIEVPESIQLAPDLDLTELNLQNFDFSRFEPDGTFVQRLYQANPNLKIIGTVWSPPGWMKTNGQPALGALRPDRYAHFGKFCAAAVVGFQQRYNAPFYAFSFQNEPRFANPFHSCVYEPGEYAAMTAQLAQSFQQFNVNTKVFGAENHAFVPSWITGYAQAIYDNPIARARLDIHAIHGYATDGSSNQSSLAGWQSLRNALAPMNWPKTWLTEESGQEPNWFGGDSGHGALWLGKTIHDAIVGGEVNAYVHWALTDPQPSNFALMGLDQPTKKYHAFRQYARFIQPGMVRLGVAPSDGIVLVNAFIDPGNRQIQLVALNMANAWATANLNFRMPQGWRIARVQHVRTSGSDNSAVQPDLAFSPASTVLPLSPGSINTLTITYRAPRP